MKVGTAIISMRIYAVNLDLKLLRKEIDFAVSHSKKFFARSAQKSEQHLFLLVPKPALIHNVDYVLYVSLSNYSHTNHCSSFFLSFVAAVQYFSSLLVL